MPLPVGGSVLALVRIYNHTSYSSDAMIDILFRLGVSLAILSGILRIVAIAGEAAMR